MAEKHLCVSKLAERWGLNPKTLDRWRQRGCGPRFLKIGGHVLYRVRDIEAYEDNQLRQITDKDPGVPLTADHNPLFSAHLHDA
ncbi:MAG: helix-turn-helix domain-containing protein [Alphaproteobacteria bacterium]|nr:helix-turn-helix domain-containing protein [Alphaproteobacteria bacterium]